MEASYLECIKIKDGLYIGNFEAAKDYEFLTTNKFEYIVNCSIEIPNYYEDQPNFKYIKFKLSKNKNHKLWEDQNLKKLNKLLKFIQQSQQNSSCCLIHSQNGNNRSLVMVVAYLMTKFSWKIVKCLEYIKNKNIFIALSDHNIEQLYLLENILSNHAQLTTQWRIHYQSEQEEILSKTFLNSKLHEIQSYRLKEGIKKQTNKRVVWLDKLTKAKNNQISAQKTQIETNKQKTQTKKPTSLTKDKKTLTKTQIAKKSSNKYEQEQDYQQEIFKFIKKNLKFKKQELCQSKAQQNSKDNVRNNNKANMYSLTINNYIQPNINIINNVKKVETETKKSLNKKRPLSGGNYRNQQYTKNNFQEKRTQRAITQKDGLKIPKNTKSQKIVKDKKKQLPNQIPKNIQKNTK